MIIISALLIIVALTIILWLSASMEFKLKATYPRVKSYYWYIGICILVMLFSSVHLTELTQKSETDTIKDYNKGLYQEKITYESIDVNIIPQDTIYIFKK